jgi:hypothetical protein
MTEGFSNEWLRLFNLYFLNNKLTRGTNSNHFRSFDHVNLITDESGKATETLAEQ